jgi:perosamine synthetase
LAQLERLDGFLERKRTIAELYREYLEGLPVTFQECSAEAESPEWMFSLLLPGGLGRDEVADFMLRSGVDTRPVFTCMHQLPPYRSKLSYEAAEYIARNGISLPSYPGLRDHEVNRVAQAFSNAVEHLSPASFKQASTR